MLRSVDTKPHRPCGTAGEEREPFWLIRWLTRTCCIGKGNEEQHKVHSGARFLLECAAPKT